MVANLNTFLWDNLFPLSPLLRLTPREKYTAKIHGAQHLQKQKPIEPESAFGKAITFMTNQWPKLIGLLDHEGVELDNNLIESKIRPLGHHRGRTKPWKTKSLVCAP
jgi:hypothetical protein